MEAYATTNTSTVQDSQAAGPSYTAPPTMCAASTSSVSQADKEKPATVRTEATHTPAENESAGKPAFTPEPSTSSTRWGLATYTSQHWLQCTKSYLFTKLGTVEDDLALSESSSDESDTELAEATQELQKEVMDM